MEIASIEDSDNSSDQRRTSSKYEMIKPRLKKDFEKQQKSSMLSGEMYKGLSAAQFSANQDMILNTRPRQFSEEYETKQITKSDHQTNLLNTGYHLLGNMNKSSNQETVNFQLPSRVRSNDKLKINDEIPVNMNHPIMPHINDKQFLDVSDMVNMGENNGSNLILDSSSNRNQAHLKLNRFSDLLFEKNDIEHLDDIRGLEEFVQANKKEGPSQEHNKQVKQQQ